MPAPKEDPRTQRVVVKMNTADLATLDQRRGDTSRGAYLRGLLAASPAAARARARPAPAKPTEPGSGPASGHPAGHRPSWIGDLKTGRRCSVCQYREIL